MAAGVPVVATVVSGNVDLIRDGDNGRLVPAEDPKALARALFEVLSDPGGMGSRGRDTVLARCEIGRVVDRYEELFRRLRRCS
jgi:glycosyltransferase involved in cell wall biosynthesis